jgi:hypothetical protein
VPRVAGRRAAGCSYSFWMLREFGRYRRIGIWQEVSNALLQCGSQSLCREDCGVSPQFQYAVAYLWSLGPPTVASVYARLAQQLSEQDASKMKDSQT